MGETRHSKHHGDLTSLTHLLRLHQVHLHDLLLILLQSLLLHNDDLLVVKVLLLGGHVSSRSLHHGHHRHHGHLNHLRSLSNFNFRSLSHSLYFSRLFGLFVFLLLLCLGLFWFRNCFNLLSNYNWLSNLRNAGDFDRDLNNSFGDNMDLLGTTGSHFFAIFDFRFVNTGSFFLLAGLLLFLALWFVSGRILDCRLNNDSSVINNIIFNRKIFRLYNRLNDHLLGFDDCLNNLLGGGFGGSSLSFDSFKFSFLLFL